MGDWKGVRFNAGINADAPIQLFNLARISVKPKISLRNTPRWSRK